MSSNLTLSAIHSMIERIKDYPGYLVRLPGNVETFQPTRDAIVFFHGFPSNAAVKNLDLAMWLRESLRTDVYVLHYRGLGESYGTFRFTNSIQEARDLIPFLRNSRNHKKFHLIGHSWGGLISVNLALVHGDHLKQVVLLSPFCFIEKSEPLYEWFIEGIRAEAPGIFGDLKRAEIAEDFDRVIQDHLPMDLAPRLSENLSFSVIQSAQDQITPAQITQKFAARLKRPPTYMELNQDHSFTQNRRELSDALIAALKVLSV